MSDAKPSSWVISTVAAFIGCIAVTGCVGKKATQPTPDASAAAISHAQLVAAAKKEGQLTVVALPHDWCGYGNLLEGFKAKYGLTVNERDPEFGSEDELNAIRASKADRVQAPDVVDLGLAFAMQAKTEGLLQPYRVSNWGSIPDDMKDVDGYWYGDYYGVLVFQINTDVVKFLPKDWADLQDAAYRKSVALDADPRRSNQANLSVYAAGRAGGVTDAALASEAGLDYFAKLDKIENLVPMASTAARFTSGATPLVIRWDYLALADRDYFKGNTNIAVIVPQSGLVAAFYTQAISAFAPHPNAAKLWMEYLFSDEGQIGYLRGYCHPIRSKDLYARGAIPSDLVAKWPPATAYDKVVFPTLDERAIVKKIVGDKWDAVVGVDVK